MSSNDTFLAYYYRKDGRPVVRIDTQQREFLRELKNAVSGLAAGETTQFEVRPSPHLFFPEEISRFTMRASKYGRPHIKVFRPKTGKVVILWQDSEGEWDNTLGLLEGLIESTAPAWLNFGGPFDDAELEISLGEGRPSELATDASI